MKLKESEHDIQAAFCDWMDLFHPKILYYAIPNQMKPEQIGRKKREGMKKSVPDLFIAYPRWNSFFQPKEVRFFCAGCYIEFKTPGARMNTKHAKDQIAMHERLRDLGYCCEVHDSVDEAAAFVARHISGGCLI